MSRLCCEPNNISSVRVICSLFSAMAVFWQGAGTHNVDVQHQAALGGNACDPWCPQDQACERPEPSSAADLTPWCIAGPTFADCRRYPGYQLDR